MYKFIKTEKKIKLSTCKTLYILRDLKFEDDITTRKA